MRYGFRPTVNPPTKVSAHQGTPTEHARKLATDLTEARTAVERYAAEEAAFDFADGTSYIPDRRYLDKILASEHCVLGTDCDDTLCAR